MQDKFALFLTKTAHFSFPPPLPQKQRPQPLAVGATDCQKTCPVTSIGGKDTIDWQGQTRLTACLSGAFCSFRLGLRQQACGSKTKNHSKIHRWQVRSSFAGAEMCPDKKRPAENTCRIVKGLDAVWAHFCPSKPCLPLSIDGSVKGNRQGSLSRSITRRSGQNCKIKYCFYFAILSQLVKKVRMDFFDKLQRPQPTAAGAVKC
mgnify:CR=1 FL=1